MIQRIQNLSIDDARGFSSATLEPVPELEADDSEEEQFKRRMGMRTYFKHLNMSLVRIRNSKIARQSKGNNKIVVEE